MPTALYDEVFAIPVAYTRPKAQAPLRPRDEELEFSEYGRSPRLPAGWYLAPALLVWPVILAMLFF